ncbi:hypothetical protein CAPTEDRAFT_218115 [Capitella teleta]|uniref:BRCA1-associated ATM activator 1 n=1 Tax=Capitella teleta TaxID=283909 RepID=R7U7E9_CAPTE|nr:hypothetical protein CAPTEDRAFT_218115 [Capitella teleta]|eukprot:ELU02056.1 hypothetical protein CAPTEDRAFT_218115 [Capitella teleta]
MDSKVLNLKTHLRGVCAITESFLDNRFPSDDTQAPKFISLLCNMISDESSCLMFIEETKFLSKVDYQLKCDPSEELLTFQMHVLSHVFITVASDLIPNLKSCLEALLRKPFLTPSWEKPSVRYAWIQSLGKILKGKQDEGLEMVLSEDFLVTLMKCYDDSSIFVGKEAVVLTAKLLWQLLIMTKHQDPILKLTEQIFSLSPISTSYKCNILRVREVLETLNKLAVGSFDVLNEFLSVNNVRQKLLMTLKSVALTSDTVSVQALASSLALPFWRDDKELFNLARNLFEEDHVPLPSLIIFKSVISKDEMNNARELISMPFMLSTRNSISSCDWLKSFMKKHKRKADQIIVHCLDLHKSLNPTEDDFVLLTELLTTGSNPLVSCRILQVLSDFMTNSQGVTLPVCNLLSVCLNLIKEVGCHQRVLTEVFHCILSTLAVRNAADILVVEISCDSLSGAIFGEVLSDIVQRKLCDLEWEIRDTSVEFLCCILTQLKGDKDMLDWLTANNLLMQAKQCLSDGERYVRASAIKTLTAAIKWNDLWIHFKNSKCNIVDQIINVIKTDSEAFPRRAAVEFISEIHFIDNSAAAHTIPIMKIAIDDFDWQVKLSVLEFWNKYWKSLERDDAIEHFTQIAGSLLIDGILDCDRSVQKLACSITVDIYSDYITCSSSALVEMEKKPEKDWKLDEFSKALASLDVEKRLREASRSIDEYDENPSSLLTDLMTSLNPSAIDPDADQFMIDCY